MNKIKPDWTLILFVVLGAVSGFGHWYTGEKRKQTEARIVALEERL